MRPVLSYGASFQRPAKCILFKAFFPNTAVAGFISRLKKTSDGSQIQGHRGPPTCGERKRPHDARSPRAAFLHRPGNAAGVKTLLSHVSSVVRISPVGRSGEFQKHAIYPGFSTASSAPETACSVFSHLLTPRHGGQHQGTPPCQTLSLVPT